MRRSTAMAEKIIAGAADEKPRELEHWQFGEMASMAICMSVKPPKAEVARRRWHFRYVPLTEVIGDANSGNFGKRLF